MSAGADDAGATLSGDLRVAQPEPAVAGGNAVPPGTITAPSAAVTTASPWIPARRVILALLRRDLTERRGLGLPFLLDLAFGVLNLLVFLFVSQVLTLAPHADFAGSVSYFDFVAMGIVFLLVLQAATIQVVARLATEQRDGTLELLATQPTPGWALAFGLAAYPFAFALLRAGVYLGLLVGFFGLRVDARHWLAVVVVLALGALCTVPFGVALMGLTLAVGHGDSAARLLVLTLSLLSGTYFPTSALPDIAHPVCAVLPTRIALEELRLAAAGDSGVGPVLTLAGIAVVLLPLSAWIFDRALRIARRRGG